jgi:hypothetical protein
MAVIFLLNPNPKVAKTESLGAGRVPYREVYSLPERCFCVNNFKGIIGKSKHSRINNC